MLRAITFTVLALSSGCASGGGATPGQEFSMAIGARVTLPDATRLHYVGIANDSRCPPKVQCIRAGDADVLFDLVRDGTSARITLNTERTLAAPAGAWTLHLVALTPGGAPKATLRIDPR